MYVRTTLMQTQVPIKEIQRLVSRSSSSFREIRLKGGDAKDTAVAMLDSFDNLWKAATLLRPGFVPRMVSDEILARMFKFGGMATLVDTGKGMGFDQQARAFDSFESGDRRGAGLGLALVRSFVEMHGGWVALTSEPGRGVTVTCHLPADAPAVAPKAA